MFLEYVVHSSKNPHRFEDIGLIWNNVLNGMRRFGMSPTRLAHVLHSSHCLLFAYIAIRPTVSQFKILSRKNCYVPAMAAKGRLQYLLRPFCECIIKISQSLEDTDVKLLISLLYRGDNSSRCEIFQWNVFCDTETVPRVTCPNGKIIFDMLSNRKQIHITHRIARLISLLIDHNHLTVTIFVLMKWSLNAEEMIW